MKIPTLSKLFSNMMGLIYPDNCRACGRSLYLHEKYICYHCWNSLPQFNADELKNYYSVKRNFEGRVLIHYAFSLFQYIKGGKVRFLLYALKYKGDKHLGVYLGTEIGKRIKEIIYNNANTYLVPVPLYPKKKAKRGYNQTEYICYGIERVIKIPINTRVLKRTEDTTTQTKKGRYARFVNIEHAFCLNEVLPKYENAHFIIVDDVLTTGSTIESCALQLQKIKGVKISVVTIAAVI